MITKTGIDNDIILISGEYYDDHPMSPVGVIARVLDAKGYRVGIIERPVSKEDYERLGTPNLFFGVTSGSIDSMVNNYTPFKKKRSLDPHQTNYPLPDRALIHYCNQIKRFYKGVPIVIGGIEASLRRFAHYDYWDSQVRRSLLFDTRADILVYGNGEKQILEIASRIKSGNDLKGIEGTCIISDRVDDSFEKIPSFQQVVEDKIQFCRMQTAFANRKNMAQEYDRKWLLQYRYPEYTTRDLDWIYSLPFSRDLHPKSLLEMGRFSVVTHRGCVGRCSFCSLALHQGDKIISRSEDSVIEEIKRCVKHPKFKGYIDDLGGPSANMYGMDCNTRCSGCCLKCKKLDQTHDRLIRLLERVRHISGVKKVFIRSGIRYDLAMRSPDYIRQISRHHISGCLKIAPEHFSQRVLKLMNKTAVRFDEFVQYYESVNSGSKQGLRYYLMIGHPGEDAKELLTLIKKAKTMKNIEQFQFFTPTPMTVSTCMYWTGMDPFTLRPVYVVRDYREKEKMKRKMLELVQDKSDLARSHKSKKPFSPKKIGKNYSNL